MNKRIITILLALAVCGGARAQWKQGDVPPSSRRANIPPTEIDKAEVTVYYAFNADDIKDERTYIDLGWLQVGKRYTEYAIMPMRLDNECCYYTEPLPKQQWTLGDEQQTIHGYHCQRATCHWRGRDYEAWFTTEIPIRRGPWKFGGLPGLIVKISDAKKEYNFELVKLEQTQRPILQYNFSRFRKVSRKDMLKLQRKINENWVRLLSPEAAHKFPDHPYSPMELE